MAEVFIHQQTKVTFIDIEHKTAANLLSKMTKIDVSLIWFHAVEPPILKNHSKPLEVLVNTLLALTY